MTQPQILQCTPEQLATFTRQKTRAVRETQTNDVDTMTGEILRTTDSKILMTSTEPDYIKVYYRTILAFGGITDIPVDFLIALSGYISWVSDKEPMLLRTDKVTRTYMCETLNISASMFTKYITRCVKRGLLVKKTDFRGVYEVNPFFIAKGRWDDIKALRCTFDYIEGRWSKHMETSDGEVSSVSSED